VVSAQSSSSYDQSEDQVASDGSPEVDPVVRQAKKVYYIAREIMTSEAAYVEVLRLVYVNFRDFILTAKGESKSMIIPDEEFNGLFSNLKELLTLNSDLLRDFEDRVENWDTSQRIADVIVKKGPYLKLYTMYIKDFQRTMSSFSACCSKYPKFDKLVKEFEAQSICKQLKLSNHMLKPVQRLPQYRMLLDDYLKHLERDSKDFDQTTAALRIVTEAAEHANSNVVLQEEFQRMLKLQARLGDWELIKPGRELIKEGELQKISRKGEISRYFILLSDSLLYTIYQGGWSENCGLKVRYSLSLNQVAVNLPASAEFNTEFSIKSSVRSFSLRAKDVRERIDWVESISSAVENFRSRAATFSSGPADIAVLTAPLGSAAPVWVPDDRVTMCQVCSADFSFTCRRHHCRACGKAVCSGCSGHRAPLKYQQWESQRVCDICFDILEKAHGSDDHLRPRFKRKEGKVVGKYIPQRLKMKANDEGSQMSGHLKRKNKGGKWKRHWFVLRDRVLYTYKASEDTTAVETFPVLGWNLEPLSDKNFELYEGLAPGLVFELRHGGAECLIFAAENDNLAEKWMTALREATTFE